MNLQPQAEIEPARKTRSKLEAHREAIFALRRKHWSYRQIAKWLNEHGISVTFPSVYRFCERAIARRPRGSSAASTEAPIVAPVVSTFFQQTLQTQTHNTAPVKKHRFNEPE